jgi:hypothetical protein
VFRADTLENVLVFLAVKAAQRIPAEDIHFEGCAYLVPELFKLDRGVRITFRPQERRTFSTSHNPRGCSLVSALVAVSIRPPTTSKNRAESSVSFTMKVESVLVTSNGMYVPC